MEEENRVPNERNGYERVSRARNAEIQNLEADVRRFEARKAMLMNTKEAAIARKNEMEGAIDVKEAEIAVLSGKNADLLQASRENKIRIDAYFRQLIPNTTEFQDLQVKINDKRQEVSWDEKKEEKKNLLTTKKMLELDNEMLKVNIKGALVIKCKEKYPNQSQ